MFSKFFAKIFLIAGSVSLMLTFICITVFVSTSHLAEETTVLMQDGEEIERLELKNFVVIPGESQEYTVDLYCRVEDQYNVQVLFKGEDNSLTDKINVSVSCGEDIYSDNLSSSFEAGLQHVAYCYLKENESKTLTVRYDFDESITNEDLDKSSDFTTTFMISHFFN